MLDIFERFIRTLSRWTAQIAQLALVAAMMIIVANIILRGLGRPLGGTFELVEMTGAVLLALSVGHTALVRGHIAVGVLVERFSPRLQAVVDIIVSTTALYFVSLLTKEMFVYAGKSAARNWSTGHLMIPLAPSIYVVAFGFAVLALVLLLDLLKAVISLLNHQTIKPEFSERGTNRG